MLQNPSKRKIKIKGLEIEGFTYEETMKLIDKIMLDCREYVDEDNEKYTTTNK